MRRVLALLPLLAVVACSGGHSMPAPTPVPASTPSAAEYATIACRHYTPGTPDRDAARQFLDNANQASARDARWQPLANAAQDYYAAETGSGNLIIAISEADDACKTVP